MSLPSRFHPLAEIEIEEAAAYYYRAEPGLRDAFLDEVERGYRQLGDFPEAGAPVGRGVRKLVLKRFPYSLFYSVRGEGIRILAVAHQKRRPLYWKKRT